MLANSWLYHYYSVQSKIHFGLAFEASSTRVPPTTATTPTAAAVYYQHHHHPLVHHQNSPSQTAAVGYTAMHAHSHHHPYHHQQYQHMSYGAYHAAPSDALQQANGINTAAHNGHSLLLANVGSQFIYPHRLGLEPVDFSQETSSGGNYSVGSEMRCSSANSSASSQTASTPGFTNSSSTSQNNHNLPQTSNNKHRMHSPPPSAVSSKRRATGKLEPLYFHESRSPEDPNTHGSSTELECHYESHSSITGPIDSHASVVFATVVPTRPRFLNKTLPTDSDFMDQWNPSPPWSETAHKSSLDSSSSSQQELSPCITTTPPTPTSAPPTGSSSSALQTLGPAFSFEWMSDQLVPVIDPSRISSLTPDGVAIHPPHAYNTSAWVSGNHHQHLSHHLATSQGRVLTLQELEDRNENYKNSNKSVAGEKIIDKSDEIDDKLSKSI